MDTKKSIIPDISSDEEKAKHASNYSNKTTACEEGHIHLVQNVLLIWLDSNIDEENNEDCRNTIIQIRRVVNSVKIFRNTDECHYFLTDVNNENIFMIISGALSRTIIPLIHEVVQLNSIFIFYANDTKHELWTAKWPKVKGVFAETSLLCIAIEQVAQQCEKNAIPISFVSTSDSASNQNLDQLNQSFMYTQILKEILLTINFEEHQFIDYCQQHFVNSSRRSNRYESFEQEYHHETPIWLYTYEPFLYSMLNHALRIMDVDIIMKMGLFVCNLHRHIKELHNDQFGAHHSSKSFVVYRGQGLHKTDFDQMIKTKGGLISFNSFLSTSKNREVSLAFAESSRSDPNLIGILFVMTIEPSKSTTPFADIKGIGYFEGEYEILFSMHTIFRIRKITQMDESKRLWQVDLSLTTDNDKDLHILTEHIRKETFPNAEGWQRLGLFLLKIGQPDKAQQVYDILLNRTNSNHERAILHHQLGQTYQDQGKYCEALIFYERSLEFMQKKLRPNHPHLAASYHDIGNVYQNMREYSKAISFYKKALEIQQTTLPVNHSNLALSYNNIGSAYHNMKEYSNALLFYEQAVEIQQEILSSNHPDFATSYNNIGLVYHAMGEHSKALSFYEIALEIQRKTLPPNHPHLIVSYKNIGSVYDNMGERSKSKLFYRKGREIKTSKFS